MKGRGWGLGPVYCTIDDFWTSDRVCLGEDTGRWDVVGPLSVVATARVVTASG